MTGSYRFDGVQERVSTEVRTELFLLDEASRAERVVEKKGEVKGERSFIFVGLWCAECKQ